MLRLGQLLPAAETMDEDIRGQSPDQQLHPHSSPVAVLFINSPKPSPTARSGLRQERSFRAPGSCLAVHASDWSTAVIERPLCHIWISSSGVMAQAHRRSKRPIFYVMNGINFYVSRNTWKTWSWWNGTLRGTNQLLPIQPRKGLVSLAR